MGLGLLLLAGEHLRRLRRGAAWLGLGLGLGLGLELVLGLGLGLGLGFVRRGAAWDEAHRGRVEPQVT